MGSINSLDLYVVPNSEIKGDRILRSLTYMWVKKEIYLLFDEKLISGSCQSIRFGSCSIKNTDKDIKTMKNFIAIISEDNTVKYYEFSSSYPLLILQANAYNQSAISTFINFFTTSVSSWTFQIDSFGVIDSLAFINSRKSEFALGVYSAESSFKMETKKVSDDPIPENIKYSFISTPQNMPSVVYYAPSVFPDDNVVVCNLPYSYFSDFFDIKYSVEPIEGLFSPPGLKIIEDESVSQISSINQKEYYSLGSNRRCIKVTYSPLFFPGYRPQYSNLDMNNEDIDGLKSTSKVTYYGKIHFNVISTIGKNRYYKPVTIGFHY